MLRVDFCEGALFEFNSGISSIDFSTSTWILGGVGSLILLLERFDSAGTTATGGVSVTITTFYGVGGLTLALLDDFCEERILVF